MNLKSMLLVEDDKIDILTVKRALKDINTNFPLYVVNNGEEALEYLRNSENPHPTIILLDINMPKMNGIEFLKIAKNDEELKRIPVIVLTTSKMDQDRFESFNLSVAGYMVKPVDYDQFVETMRAIKGYWDMSEFAV